MSPPSFGQSTPVGTERVPRHLGKREQPRKSPERPWRLSIIAPHSWQVYSVGSAAFFAPASGRVYLHFFGWFSQATNGPKKPPFGTSFPPQSGHFSVSRAERSCAAAMSWSRS